MRLKTTLILIVIAVGLSLLNLVGEWQQQRELEKSAFAGLLIPIPLKDVHSFQIQSGDSLNITECRKTEGQWRLVRPINDLADHYAIEEVLALVSYGRAHKVSGISEAAAGFDENATTLTVRGLEAEEKITFGKTVPGSNSIYVQTGRQPGVIYQLDMGMASFLKRSFKEFRAMDLFAGKINKVQRIILEGTPGDAQEQRIEFERSPGGWMLRHPGIWPADGEKIEKLLKRYAQLRAKKVLSEDLGQAAAFGFERDNSVGVQVINSTGESESIVLAPPLKEGELGAAIVVGRDPIFSIADGLRHSIAITPAENYRKKRLEPLAKVEAFGEIRIEVPGSLLRLNRKGDNWFGETPRQFSVDISELNELVGMIENLTAISFIDDNPSDLTVYGLKNPNARLQIFDLDGQECVTLSIGSKTDKNEFYASLGNRTEIFTLDENTVLLFTRPWYVYHNRLIAYFTSLEQPLSLSIWQRGQDLEGPPTIKYKRLKGHAWQMELPVVRPADAEGLYRGPLSDKGLGDLRALKFVGTSGEGLEKFGLDQPLLRVVVEYVLYSVRDSKQTVSCDLEIGDPIKEFYYARSRFLGEDLIFIINSSLVDMLKTDYVD